jgi:hypothetical protein
MPARIDRQKFKQTNDQIPAGATRYRPLLPSGVNSQKAKWKFLRKLDN